MTDRPVVINLALAIVCLISTVASAVDSAVVSAPNFDYDRSAPLDVQESVPQSRTGAVVRNLTYLELSGRRNGATLVSPAKGATAPCPAVLFVHWYGSPPPHSDRTQFLDEALELAQFGVTSLLIDTPWSNPKWFAKRNPAEDLPFSVAQIKELRRALDVLTARDGVDPRRVAFVGHDFGAMYGAVLASCDRRVAAYVLMAGTKSFSDWFLLGSKLEGDARAAVVRELAVLDPSRHAGAIAPAPVLFQFARKDEYVPEADAEAFFAGARDPKERRWYDCDHALNAEAAADRVAWLKTKLGL